MKSACEAPTSLGASGLNSRRYQGVEINMPLDDESAIQKQVKESFSVPADFRLARSGR